MFYAHAGRQLQIAVHTQITAIAARPRSKALKPLRASWASLTAPSSSSYLSSPLQVRAALLPMHEASGLHL